MFSNQRADSKSDWTILVAVPGEPIEARDLLHQFRDVLYRIKSLSLAFEIFAG